MTGLFISIDDYIITPEEEAVERALEQLINEDFIIIPSRSNIPGWEKMKGKRGPDKKPRKLPIEPRLRGANGRFISKR